MGARDGAIVDYYLMIFPLKNWVVSLNSTEYLELTLKQPSLLLKLPF